jgi:sirohydrochlorin ferrochelatase
MSLQGKTALLLIAHGSRHPEANDDSHFMVSELRRLGDYDIVEAAFLELAEPNIDDGCARCVNAGANRVILLPYFLSAGVHVRRDLTDAQRRLAERFPGVRIQLAEPLGRHPKLIEVVLDRARQCGNPNNHG